MATAKRDAVRGWPALVGACLLIILPGCFASSSGPPIFVEAMDLVPLTLSLLTIIVLTIFFENVLHGLSHKFENDPIAGAVIHKITAEFTVLGFISIIVVLLLQLKVAEKLGVLQYVSEFEIAHIWIFFVGVIYVVEALVFLRQAVRVSETYLEFDRLSKASILHDIRNQKPCSNPCRGMYWRVIEQLNDCRTIFCCGCRCSSCCRKSSTVSGSIVDANQAAAHAMRGFFFKQIANGQIISGMGRHRMILFDFSTYMTQFWKREIVTSLEVSAVSWFGFLALWSVLVFARVVGDEFRRDMSMMATSQLYVTSQGLVFFIFVLIVKADAERLDRKVATVITGDKNKSTIYDAVEFLARISDSKETLDFDGLTWPSIDIDDKSSGGEIEKVEKHYSTADRRSDADRRTQSITIEMGPLEDSNKGKTLKNSVKEGETEQLVNSQSSSNINGAADAEASQHERGTGLTGFKIRARHQVMSRIREALNEHKHLCLSSRWRSTIFSILLFAHSFSYGIFLFLVAPEMNNAQMLYGAVSTVDNHNASQVAHHRILAGQDSGHESSDDGRGIGWRTCLEYKNDGAKLHKQLSWGEASYKVEDFEGRKGDERFCSVHSSDDVGMWVLRAFFWIFPIMFTTFVSIPQYLGHHAQIKSIGDLWRVYGGDSNKQKSCCGKSDQRSHHEDDSHDSHAHINMGDHGAHTRHSHNHGSCCTDFLFGKDHTNFNGLIKEVCDICNDRHETLLMIRSQILLAIQLYPEGMQDVREFLLPVKVEKTGLQVKYSLDKMSGEFTKAAKKMIGSAGLDGLFSGKVDAEERFLTPQLSELWEEDEAKGSRKLEKLVDEFLSLLKRLPVQSQTDLGQSTGNLSSASLILGIRVLLRLRLGGLVGRRFSTKMELDFLKFIDSDMSGSVSEIEFKKFVIRNVIMDKNPQRNGSPERRNTHSKPNALFVALSLLERKRSHSGRSIAARTMSRSPLSTVEKASDNHEVQNLRVQLRRESARVQALEKQIADLQGIQKAN